MSLAHEECYIANSLRTEVSIEPRIELAPRRLGGRPRGEHLAHDAQRVAGEDALRLAGERPLERLARACHRSDAYSSPVIVGLMKPSRSEPIADVVVAAGGLVDLA